MEDHKRKNKKRNQNKKPTPEQIKKLQNNIDQKEVKVNGVTENGDSKANHSTSSDKHASEPEENKVHFENQVNGESKKSKKKNKPKGKPNENSNENQTQTVNINSTEKERGDQQIYNSSEKIEKEAQLASEIVTNSQNVNVDTLVGIYPNKHNHGCSQEHSTNSSPCSQYHSDEAPNCSHHIQHQLNKLNVGDLKIDFDIQKLMLPMASQSGASNQEYFYKGLNIDKLEVVNNERPEAVRNEKINQDIMPNEKQTSRILIDDSVTKSGTPVSIDSVVKNLVGNPGSKGSAFVNPDEMMKNMFGNLGNQSSKLPNPDEILKSMFGSNPNKTALNPEDLLKRVFGSPGNEQNKSNNPEELMKNMFGNLGNQSSGPLNPNDLLKNMFGAAEPQTSNPVDIPLDGVENTENKKNIPINHKDLMKNMFGNMENPMDMFGQMNAMAQQMDPNMMNSMNQMMSKMDPAVLSGMTNMVAGLMQGGGLGAKLQNMMQMEPQQLNDSKKIEIIETLSQSKSEGDQKRVEVSTESLQINQTLETPPEDTKEIKDSKDVDENNDVEKFSNKEENYSKKPEDPVLKCSFSFSSNTSEKSGNEMTEKSETIQVLGKEDSQVGPSNPKGFVREESMPELLENLCKVNKEEQVKTKKVEIKTSKFKTILSKVLRKEKKTLAGETCISTTEIQTQRVEYQKNKTPNKNEARKEELDYEKLHHVKEPMEFRERKEIKTIPRRAQEIKDPARDEKGTFKHTGEDNGQNQTVNQSALDNEIIAPNNNNFEFNLESMNEIFTNLLQGKKLEAANCNSKVESTGKQTNDPLGKVKDQMKKSMDNSGINYKGEGNGNDDQENVNNSTNFDKTMQKNMSSIFSNIMQMTNDDSKETSEKLPDFEIMMNQMMKGFPFKDSQIKEDDNGGPIQSENSDDKVQNMQRSLMEQFAKKAGESESGVPNLLEGMSEMFDTFLTNGDQSNTPDFNAILGNPENITNILKMGEMLFGKSPFDLAEMNGEINITKDPENCFNDKNQTNKEDSNDKPISKNVYQHERPSILLKELLGEEFWSVRKKRNNLTQLVKPKSSKKSRKDNSKDENKSTDTKKVECPQTTTKNATHSEPLPSNSAASFEMELEKESPFVRMMHRKIQKDSKLQQYLKEKLQKDPKMQKFIQDKLQKDERLQKIIQEKLSKDKNLRKTFEDKFKNELGLTGIIPKFDDDDDEVSEDDKEKAGVEENKKAEARAVEDPADNQKPKKNTALLIKKYAELTISLIVIVYVGILCY